MRYKRSWFLLVVVAVFVPQDVVYGFRDRNYVRFIGQKFLRVHYVTRSISRIKRELDASQNTFNINMQHVPTKNLKVFYDVMKEGGWLQREGFITSNYMESTAENKPIMFVRCFRSFEHILHEITKSSANRKLTSSDVKNMKEDGKGSLYVVTNFLIHPINLKDLITWLEQAVKSRMDETPGSLKHCKARMIIEYHCCTSTLLPSLKPKFAELRVRVG